MHQKINPSLPENLHSFWKYDTSSASSATGFSHVCLALGLTPDLVIQVENGVEEIGVGEVADGVVGELVALGDRWWGDYLDNEEQRNGQKQDYDSGKNHYYRLATLASVECEGLVWVLLLITESYQR